jgi:hypothetical protein
MYDFSGFDDLMGFKTFLDFPLFTCFPDFQFLFEFLQFVTVFFELGGYMFRWFKDRLKIDPANQFILDKVDCIHNQ